MNDQMEFINGNQVALGGDGWALLAPFGDTHYPLKIGNKTETVIQRITKENATEMVNAFKSIAGKVSRWLRGSPIYLGHPDDPQTGHKYPVKDQVGMFADLEVRDDGLYVRPMFNSKGAEILDKPDKYYFSGRWPVKPTGKSGDMTIYEPINVTSIGITKTPNLQTEMLNTENNFMDRTKLIAVLAKAGITLSNEATDAQVEAAIESIGAAKTTAETTLANERKTIVDLNAELKTLKDQNEAARKSEIESLINERITSGVITAAEKDLWQGRLTANFVNEAPALKALQPKLKTQQNGSVNGDRTRNPAGESQTAAARIVTLANERMAKTGKSYQVCAAEVSDENPDLVKAAFGSNE